MGHQKILNLLNESSDSTFVVRKWSIVKYQWNASYSVGNETIYNREVLKSNLCDCNVTDVLVRVDICTIAAHATLIAFKTWGPFTKCITTIDGAAIDDADL